MKEAVDAVGREILKRHFPKAEPSKIDWHAVWLSPPTVLYLSPYEFVKEGGELENRLEDFRKAMLDAWKAYKAIPTQVSWKQKSFSWTEFANITRATTGLPVIGGQRRIQPPALKAMRKAAQGLTKLSAQAIAAEYPEKVCLVQHARNAWQDIFGVEPALIPSGKSPFLAFIEDVIEGAKKEWNAEATLRVWLRARSKLEP